MLLRMKIGGSVRALAIAAAMLALPAAAQQTPQAQTQPAQHEAAPSPAAASSVAAKPVHLLAVVLDKKGQPVSNLARQDFVLEQDGRAQTLTQATPDTGLPMTVGVVADTGVGQRKALAEERKAGTDFLNHLLRAGTDHGFVLHFDREVELLQDVTTSHDKLAKGVGEIAVSGEPGGHHEDEAGQPRFTFGGEVLYDAIFLSADEVLKGWSGRKAVVLFSDGVDRSSKTSLAKAVEAAQRANLLVYCVYVPSERPAERNEESGRRQGGYPGGYPGGGYPSPFPGGGYPGGYPGGNPGGYPGGPFPGGGYPGGHPRQPEKLPRVSADEGKRILQQVAAETGGRYFELSKKMNAAQIYAQIEQELRHQYSLSYTPETATAGYHTLHITTRTPGLTVEARTGDYE
jgi:VWFA-related protein